MGKIHGLSVVYLRFSPTAWSVLLSYFSKLDLRDEYAVIRKDVAFSSCVNFGNFGYGLGY